MLGSRRLSCRIAFTHRSPLRKRISFFLPRLETLEERCVPTGTPNTWMAVGASGLWNTSGNWSLGHVPTSSEIATFDATSSAACIIDAPAAGTNTVSGINMTAAYLGAINDTADIMIGADGFIGGTFAVTGSTTITVDGDWAEAISGGFLGGSGTVNFDAASSQTIQDLNSSFNNLTHSGSGTLNLTSGASALTLSGNFVNSSGIVDAHGTSLSLPGNWSDSASVINLGPVTFSGSTLQTITSNSNFNNLTYSGTNTLQLSSAITLTENLMITAGTFDANNTNVTIGGNWSNLSTVSNTATVTFNGGTGTTQQLDNGLSSLSSIIHSGAGTVELINNPLTVTGTLDNTAGTLEANGLNLSIGGLTTVSSSTLQNSGAADLMTLTGGLDLETGTLSSGLGTASLGAGVTSNSSTTMCSISGNLNLGGANRTFTVSGLLDIGALVSNGGISKAGGGTMHLNHANSYTGGTFINGGFLAPTVDGALGPGTGGTSVALGAFLLLAGVNYSTAEPVTLNGGGIFADVTTLGARNSTFAGPITIGAAGSTIGTSLLGNIMLTLNGMIDLQGNNLIVDVTETTTGAGPTTFIFNGPITGTSTGSLTVAPSGSFTLPGILTLNGAGNYGGGTTVKSGTLIVGNDTAVGTGILDLGDNTTIRAVGGNHSLANAVSLASITTIGPGPDTLTLSGVVFGSGQIGIAGFILNGNLTLSGNNDFGAGILVNSGATLGVGTFFGSALGTGPLLLNNGSNLIAVGGPRSFINPVTLTGNANVGGVNDLGIVGTVSGSGSLTDSDTGILSLLAANSYSGGTTVIAGTLSGESNVPGSTRFGTGPVTLNNGTTLSLVLTNPTFNNVLILNGTSTIQVLGGPGPVTWDGLISGTGGFVLTSPASNGPDLILTANNTYSGPTIIGSSTEAGSLEIKGAQPNSPVSINGGGVLFANGTIGGLTVNEVDTRVVFSIESLAPGTGYSQIRVNGTVNLGAGFASLQLENGVFKPQPGDQFRLIDNSGGQPISGFFSGLPEGTVVTMLSSGMSLGRIKFTYQGAPNGNDFVVTAVPIVSIVGRVSSNGQWWLGQSNGTGFTNQLLATWSPAVTWVDVHTGDFNGDGHQDIVGRDLATGNLWVALSNGSNLFTSHLWGHWIPSATWVDVQVADFNGDGKTDIVGRYAQTGQWWIAQSTGSSFVNALWGTWNPALTWVDVKVGDFNGDGKADIIGRYLQGGSWWAGISTGSSFSTSLWGSWLPSATWVDVNVGDFNGDGKADLVGRYFQNGQWWVSLSTGSSLTNSLWATWNPNATWVDVKVGDFNGDGLADITGRFLQGGQWYTAISTGSSFTTSLWGQWNPNLTWADVQVGDFNGDGKSDITGRFLQSGQWFTAISTGSSFTTSLWGAWNPDASWVDVQNGSYV
jgi:autotransporter-associated beta strand protein